MFFSELQADLYRRLGYATAPAAEVTTRLNAFINEIHRKIVATPGMSPLRDSTISIASVSGQEYLALPQVVGRIKAITDRGGGTPLAEFSLQAIRAMNPEQTQGYPERFAVLGWRGVTVQPSDASSIFVDSTSASDTGTALITGWRTGGYRATDTVTMTGTTAVDLGSYSDWEQIESFSLSAAAVGTVTLHEDSGSGTTLATIPIGEQKAKYKHILLDPVPDSSRTYHIDFERRIIDLSAAYDEVLIPDDFAYVLLAGVRSLEYERRNDSRRAREAEEEFRKGMADMLYFVQTSGVPHTRPSRTQRGGEFGTHNLQAGLMFGTALGNTIGTPTTGDLIYGASDGQWTSLGIGSSGQALIVSGGIPAWSSNVISLAAARGSLIYGNSTPEWAALTVGAANRLLGSDGTDVSWVQGDHGAALTGLSDDDHTQYALLAGRSGGQTLHGGTGASDNLTFQSTSNATKGNILFEELDALVIGGGTSATELRLLEPSGSGTNYTGFKAQAMAGNLVYTLPAADGSNGQALTTDGSLGLSWATISGGGKPFLVFTPHANQPPSSNFATLDTRNNIFVLDFDATTTETAVFGGVLSPDYAGGGLTVEVYWMGTTATSGSVTWEASIERGNTDMDSDSFASANFATSATNGTSGILTKTAITFTDGADMDSLAAGEAFRLKIERDADGTNGTDDMTGDAEVFAVVVRET